MNCNLFRDSVEISDAKKVVSAALEKGRQMNFQIAAAVVDVRGSVLVAEKMEGASALTTQLAEGKAAAAALLGRSIRDLYQSVQENPASSDRSANVNTRMTATLHMHPWDRDSLQRCRAS